MDLATVLLQAAEALQRRLARALRSRIRLWLPET
jgi:hypothetical protein